MGGQVPQDAMLAFRLLNAVSLAFSVVMYPISDSNTSAFFILAPSPVINQNHTVRRFSTQSPINECFMPFIFRLISRAVLWSNIDKFPSNVVPRFPTR